MNGVVKWIGVRPMRKAPVEMQTSVFADIASGLSGDHDTQPHRQVTLISAEALEKTARLLSVPVVDPAKTRRNILIAGIDFDIAPGTQMILGEAIVEITGPCLPCSRMDENLGEGGRAAMADAGGLTARIVKSGRISTGDSVEIWQEAGLQSVPENL